jgi:hypothetical protein
MWRKYPHTVTKTPQLGHNWPGTFQGYPFQSIENKGDFAEFRLAIRQNEGRAGFPARPIYATVTAI